MPFQRLATAAKLQQEHPRHRARFSRTAHSTTVTGLTQVRFDWCTGMQPDNRG
ncbi:hypothetical protein ACO0LL_25380 [Undibacterium sp. TC4M20W]|uniref:hypothetical protein n=1 Tax=unclassified Undibacterium TaxID=2630295 RepID=UPI003BF1E846